jgi:hypothetical protein
MKRKIIKTMKRRIFSVITTGLVFALGAALGGAQTLKPEDKQIEVKIYLQKTLIDPSGATSDELAPVTRRVNAAAPLGAALETLFAPNITAEEEKQNFYASTFGMKFEGVSLKNGTALVRFSQPPDETGYGSAGAGIFAAAIERTTRQFPTVRRVRICAVGETLIDSELLDPFPRCPKVK